MALATSMALRVMSFISPCAADQDRGPSLAFKKKRKGTRGVALVLTLSLLALLTIMLIAFVSLASRDRSITQSYTQSLRADQLALSGLDQVVSQIQSEISDPKNSTINGSPASFPIYVPQDPTNAVPQRMVSETLAPIVTMSGSNLYSDATNFASGGNLTATASLNNRSVSISRWEKPQLLTSSAINSFTSPSWIIVTRNGPQSFTGSTPTAASLTISGLGNMNAALGRYAYVVYDTSGLIDINAAGYPSTAAGAAAVKGVLPWADLTQITNAITQSDVDNMVNWRNAANAATYTTYVTNTWSTNGFMRVAPGDTTFLTRQELIKYAQTQNTDLSNAMPYLTTFSREVNGPTWLPTTPTGSFTSSINYTSLRYTPNTTNPAIFNPKVASGGWTRDNGTTAVTGEPLVKYRFPLKKLALLEKQGTTGLSTQDTSDILKYFGLRLFNDSAGLYRHWVYTNPAGTTSATTILTLDQVAALNREPDFFELLQAGILSGSLGQVGRADNTSVGQWALGFGPAGFIDTDKRADYQIIRIGANIIDQWDSDSDPTRITYNGEDFYGIEDLPYINKMFARVNGGGPPWFGGIPTAPYNYYLYFELWNPHQQQAGAYPNYPAKFQIVPLSGTGSPPKQDCFSLGIHTDGNNWWYYNLSSGTWASSPQYVTFSSLTGGGAMSFTATASSFREPAVVPSTSAGWAGGPNYANLFLGQIPAFPAFGVNSNNGIPWPWSTIASLGASGTTFTQNAANLIINAAFQLQYSDGSGWHTYATFEGLADPNLPNGFLDNIGLIPQQSNNLNNVGSFPKSDPRTFRFGPGENLPNFIVPGAPNLVSEGNTLTPTANTLFSPVYGNLAPFLGRVNSSNTTPVRIDMWSVNDSTVTPSGGVWPTPSGYSLALPDGVSYFDPDGIKRVGDARYAYSGNSPYFTAGTTRPARPIVLNRPFTSVGDLGFAYRDMPWKTLDLFSPNSADAGLLDLFTLTDGPIIAGRVNPNTASVPVLQALLSGEQANSSGANTNLTTSAASSIAAALSTTTATTPLVNRASLVSDFMTNSAVNSFSTIKPEREAVVRSLAESANTRTWNFLIDIIAQSGGYPKTATTLDNFLVTGERRYWLHIAIDRYTGQVVDKQLEIVNE